MTRRCGTQAKCALDVKEALFGIAKGMWKEGKTREAAAVLGSVADGLGPGMLLANVLTFHAQVLLDAGQTGEAMQARKLSWLCP